MALIEEVRPIPGWNWILFKPKQVKKNKIVDLASNIDLIISLEDENDTYKAIEDIPDLKRCPIWQISRPLESNSSTTKTQTAKTSYQNTIITTDVCLGLFSEEYEAPSRQLNSVIIIADNTKNTNKSMPDYGRFIYDQLRTSFEAQILVPGLDVLLGALERGIEVRCASHPRIWTDAVVNADAVVTANPEITWRALGMLKPVFYIGEKSNLMGASAPHLFCTNAEAIVDEMRSVAVDALLPSALNWKRQRKRELQRQFSELTDTLET